MSQNISLDLLGLHLDFSFKKIDLLYIKIVLQGEKSLHIISLESEDLLVFGIGDNKKLILLSLDLVLKLNIIVSGLHESHSKILGNNDIHDVYLLDDYTVIIEFCLKFLH